MYRTAHWLAALLGLATLTANAANNDPLVLVHGFAGWDRDELWGLYPHWGGTTDLQEELKKLGHPTVTAAVGPFSSTWDRSVELYFQLKGGCVDYGAAHAAQHGHARMGRCYNGSRPYEDAKRLPQWDAANRIHLIAHSQGAPTVNMLVELLRNGSAAERAASGSGVSELYLGGKDWVRSITTIAGANNGTTFGKLSGFNEFAKQLLKLAGATVGMGGNPEDFPYDFKLDQWGLARATGESQQQYWNRVWASPIWQSRDVGLYTLSPEGAASERAWVRTSPQVYYFSFSNATTLPGLITGNHYADPSTNLPLIPFATGMGAYRAYGDGWRQNDGVVNTISMKAPFGAPLVEYNGTPQQGKWNHMGYSQQDHWEVIGSGDVAGNLFYNWRLVNFYSQHADMLKRL